MDTISFSDFQRFRIRIGTVTSAEKVEGSEKLLKLMINLGDETKQIVAGIAKIVADPQSLVGKQIPILANLEPKSMMGLESQGMILAADNQGTPVLLHPEQTVGDGSIVR